MQKFFLILFSTIIIGHDISAQNKSESKLLDAENAIVGASRLEMYINMLEGRSIGVIANQTSIFNDTHLIDTLLSEGITIKKIFTPEHGFRGTADEGALINNRIDKKTQLPIISLYGNNKMP